MRQLFRIAALSGAILTALAACSSNDSTPSLGKDLFLQQAQGSSWKVESQMRFKNGDYSTTATLPKGEYQFRIADKAFTCGTNFGAERDAPIKLNSSVSSQACDAKANYKLNVLAAGDYEFRLERNLNGLYDLQVIRVLPKGAAATTAVSNDCPTYNGGALTVSVGSTFKEGELVRDFYSGQTAKVTGGKINITPAAESGGLLLLEAADHQPTAFSWDNATVYFVVTDRFENGDPSNDNSYGRSKDGKDEIGTFHGGDLKGLTAKLDYIASLGVNALWITAPYEQVHGWVGGGIRGDFKHYAYHGYYALDFTTVDKNMGSEEDFRTLMSEAHKRGIRVVMDVVMNHSGYATMADMQEFKFGATQSFDRPLEEVMGVSKWTDWQPARGENWHSFNNFVDYGNSVWGNTWWGREWVRTDIAGHEAPGRNDHTMSLAYLPDFITESSEVVGLPHFFKNKPDTRAKELKNATVRDYLVTWLTDWVREYGVDGFRLDTAKHLEMESITALKAAGVAALAEWKAKNPDKKLDDAPFWMTAEVWGHDVVKSPYFTQGKLDSVINFSFQGNEASSVLQCHTNAEEIFSSYASKINADASFNVLSYISSHDTSLFLDRTAKNDLGAQKKIAAPFLLLPGGVQLYYGDESGRKVGPFGSDKMQGTRSDMNWADLDKPEYKALLNHWQKIGQFRNRHLAVGAGDHSQISTAPYTFSRIKGDDRVLVVMAGN